MKVYIPKEYYKHVGYIKEDVSDTASAAAVESRMQPRQRQIPFKERFNEKLEYPKGERPVKKLIQAST
jgi:DNA/RNA endonuclease G (NUC1)